MPNDFTTEEMVDAVKNTIEGYFSFGDLKEPLNPIDLDGFENEIATTIDGFRRLIDEEAPFDNSCK